MATLVPERESTFYFDEPGGRDSRLGQRLHRVVFFLHRVSLDILGNFLLFTCFLTLSDIHETRRVDRSIRRESGVAGSRNGRTKEEGKSERRKLQSSQKVIYPEKYELDGDLCSL